MLFIGYSTQHSPFDKKTRSNKIANKTNKLPHIGNDHTIFEEEVSDDRIQRCQQNFRRRCQIYRQNLGTIE